LTRDTIFKGNNNKTTIKRYGCIIYKEINKQNISLKKVDDVSDMIVNLNVRNGWMRRKSI